MKIKNAFLPALILALFPLSASFAEQTIEYPKGEPVFTITFPDPWKLEMGEESVSATSADEMVNMELITLEADDLEGAIEMAREMLSEELEGIVFDKKLEKGELNGIAATFLNGKIVLEEVEMAVNCCLFVPGEDTDAFMLFNVVPLEALEKHGQAISKIISSVSTGEEEE